SGLKERSSRRTWHSELSSKEKHTDHIVSKRLPAFEKLEPSRPSVNRLLCCFAGEFNSLLVMRFSQRLRTTWLAQSSQNPSEKREPENYPTPSYTPPQPALYIDQEKYPTGRPDPYPTQSCRNHPSAPCWPAPCFLGE